MMFSSNQILEISGDLSHSDQLERALEFALKYSGNDKSMLQSEIDRGCKLVYQVTEDGKYCIGWGFKKVPSGWTEYPFKFDTKIVSAIIKQHLESFPLGKGGLDGSYSKGFIMKCPEYLDSKIENNSYCIVYFKPYSCFYAK